jgi:hypothetical protein
MYREVSRIVAKAEKKKMYAHLQTLAEEGGLIPPMPALLMKRFSQPLKLTGGFLLGCFFGIFALLANLILFVTFLHMQF